MILRAASTLIILGTSEDLLMFSSTFLKTAILLSKELGKLFSSGRSLRSYSILIRWDKCDKGLKCNKCHTTVERLYHPDKYKRIFCDVHICNKLTWLQRSRCNKSEICAFYHTQKERAQASKECKQFRKVSAQSPPIEINEVHEQLTLYYKNQASNVRFISLKSQQESSDSQQVKVKPQVTFQNVERTDQIQANGLKSVQIEEEEKIARDSLTSSKHSYGSMTKHPHSMNGFIPES